MKQSHKTLLLWMLLIGLLTSVYAMVGGSSGEAADAMDDGSYLPSLVFLAVVGLIVAAVAFFGRGARKAFAASEEGARLLNLGRPSAALEQFRAATALSDQPAFRFNAIVAETQLFRLTQARDALESLRKTRPPEPIASLIADQQVLIDTLLGTATDAIAASYRDREAPLARLLAAIVAVRTDRFARAHVILSESVIKQLGGYLRGLADVLIAWCAWELREERLPVDRAALFGEADAEGLLQHWPELRAFLDRAP